MDPSPDRPRRRRRWWSLSLRGMMLLILAVGGFLGWKARRASLQRRAVATIERLSGGVAYDWQIFGDDTSKWPPMEPAGPEWLREILGDAYFQEVASVELPGDEEFGGPGRTAAEKNQINHRLFEDQLACLDDVDQLKILEIEGIPLGPEGLARLAHQSRLTHLSIVGQTFRGEELAFLGRLSALRNLSVVLDRGDDADLAFLDRLPDLRLLDLSGTPVTDAGLAWIGRRNRLDRLDVDGSRLTDAGLAHLAKLKSLNFLTIRSAPGLTDAGLAHLDGLSSLWLLKLEDTPVNGITFERLRKLPRLAVLLIADGGISPRAIFDLRAAKPNMSIKVHPPRLAAPASSNPDVY